MTDYSREEDITGIERALNVAAVLGGRANPEIALYHRQFYFAAIPRDMLRVIVACMEDCTVRDGSSGTLTTSYKVRGVLHRFGDHPTIVTNAGYVREELYYKYGRKHRMDGPAYIETHRDEYGQPLRVIRHWLFEGNIHRYNLPAIVINFLGSKPYADVSWYSKGIRIGSKTVLPDDSLWEYVALP